jgi:hypothetical protein
MRAGSDTGLALPHPIASTRFLSLSLSFRVTAGLGPAVHVDAQDNPTSVRFQILTFDLIELG